MTEPSISLEAALKMMDRWEAEEKAAAEKAAAEKQKKNKKKKVKYALKAGAKQGRAWLGIHTKRLLDQVDK